MLNKRCSQLLLRIINSKEPVSILELSNIFNVSKRTIRYDLDKIDEFLANIKLPQLIRKPNVGISYNCSIVEKNIILESMGKIDFYQYVLSQDERVMYILSELLSVRDYVTIEEMANELFVSRSTIIKDMNKVRGWLNKRNLNLISTKGFGIKIEGNEKYYRKAALELLTDNVDVYKALNFIKTSKFEKMDFGIDAKLKNMFKNIDIVYIENCIDIAEEELEIKFSDEAYSALVMHIALALKRIEQGKDIIMPKEELVSLQTTKEFAVSSSIVKMLEERFKLNIPIGEIGYMTVHFLGSNASASKKINNDLIEIEIITNKLIEKVGKLLNENLRDDKQLFEGLLQHMRPTIYRLKHGLVLKNPLLTEIKKSYYQLFVAVKKGCSIIESYTNKKISDEEVGYLALHFGAAIERIQDFTGEPARPARVLVVCATGIGTAGFISEKLKQMFNVNIIGTVSYRQIKEVLEEKKVDIIVSTIPVKIDVENIKCIEVSPFLTSQNISDIKSAIRGNIYQSKKANVDLKKVIDIIGKSCEIFDAANLIKDLTNYFGVSNNLEERSTPLLALQDVLTSQSIKLNVEADSWEESIRIGGGLLEKNGLVEHKYIQAMIDIVKNMGPYIVIQPGIAMPHARPEYGVKKVGVSLITLKNPINFGNKENDPVKIVICLCSTDHSSHIKVLSELVDLLEDKNFVNEVMKARNSEDIIRFIKVK